MGSFDVSCGISNLGIHEGDRTGFLILEKVPVYRGNDFSAPGKVLVINATDLYRPLLPAVYGSYNDYGRIIDISESTTTKALEEMFHRPIQAIVDCICDDNDIYNYGGAVAKHYAITELPTFMNRSDSVEEWFLKLGFESCTQESGAFVYTFGKYDLYQEGDSSSWLIRVSETEKVLTSISGSRDIEYILNTFGHYTKMYPGFDPKDYDAIRNLNRFGGMFFLEEVFQGMDKFNNADHYMNNYENTRTTEFKEDLHEVFAALEGTNEGTDTYLVVSRCYGFETFLRQLALNSSQYHLLARFAKDESEIFALRSMLRIAESVNRPLSPSVYSGQGENDRASKMLNSIVTDVLGKRQEEWEEENIDLDDPDYSDEYNYWKLPE